MTMQGVIMFTIGPFVGWLRDYFDSFELIFNILIFGLLICAVPWVIEMTYVKMKSKTDKKINVSIRFDFLICPLCAVDIIMIRYIIHTLPGLRQ